jgi:uncharacterized protein YuzE
MVRLTYDLEVDALYLRISDAKVMDTCEIEDDVMVDYDAEGQVVGVEILDASGRLQILSQETTSAFIAKLKSEPVKA